MVLTFCGMENIVVRTRSTSGFTSWNCHSDLCRVISFQHDSSGTISIEGLLSLRFWKHCPPTRDLRVSATKNQRNRGHSSKFNFAHTLSIGRPKSHTHDKDVRLLKLSLVWEKSTSNDLRYFLEQNLQNCHNSWRCRVSSSQVLNYFHTNPIFLMLLQLIGGKTNS